VALEQVVAGVVQAALEVLPGAEVRPEGQAVQEVAPLKEYVLELHCEHEAEVLPPLVL
jgi:hypothetical protein